jgi:hypothetical protein
MAPASDVIETTWHQGRHRRLLRRRGVLDRADQIEASRHCSELRMGAGQDWAAIAMVFLSVHARKLLNILQHTRLPRPFAAGARASAPW